MLIYLAGCISYYYDNGLYCEATEWRDEAEKCLKQNGYDVFNPVKNFDENLAYTMFYGDKLVVSQNKVYLDKADMVLVNIDKLEKSPGTMFEIFYAYIKSKPVIAFGNSELLKSPHVSEAITVKFSTLSQALKFINSMYHLN